MDVCVDVCMQPLTAVRPIVLIATTPTHVSRQHNTLATHHDNNGKRPVFLLCPNAFSANVVCDKALKPMGSLSQTGFNFLHELPTLAKSIFNHRARGRG